MAGSHNPRKKALYWNSQEKRPRERPRGTWRRVMNEDIERSGKALNAIKKLVQDRRIWREFVGGLYPGPG